MQSALSMRSRPSMNFPRLSLVILSFLFPFKGFSYGIRLSRVLGGTGLTMWQKQNFHFLWWSCAVSIQSAWGIFVQLCREAFSRPHWTGNEGTSVPIAFNRLLIVPGQALFFTSCFRHQVWQRLGQKLLVVWVAANFTFNSSLTCKLKSYSEKSVCSCSWHKGMEGSDRCKMREEAAFNHSVVEVASDRPWKRAVSSLLLENWRLIRSPSAASLPRRLNSAPKESLRNPGPLLQSLPPHTFMFRKN